MSTHNYCQTGQKWPKLKPPRLIFQCRCECSEHTVHSYTQGSLDLEKTFIFKDQTTNRRIVDVVDKIRNPQTGPKRQFEKMTRPDLFLAYQNWDFFENLFIKGAFDVGDECLRWNDLMTTLGCWWPISDVSDRLNKPLLVHLHLVELDQKWVLK